MMKTMVTALFIVLFGTVTATFFPNIFSNQRHSTPSVNQRDDCSSEEDSGYLYTPYRRGSYASQGSFWETPTTPSFGAFLNRRPSYRGTDKRREELERHTTERWKKEEEDDDRSRGGSTTERYSFEQRQPTPSFSTVLKRADSREVYETNSQKNSFEVEDGFRMRLAEKWCSRYEKKCKSRRDTDNGLVSRIIGGRPAKPREHPHMVMVGYGPRDNKQWLCGGSLISSRYVLSAAHCSQTMKWGPAKWARLGVLYISSTEESTAQDKEIVERIRHPSYREPVTYHDIVLFRMDSDVVFTDWVYPACLHVGRSISASRATVTGWGRTGFVSETSPVLLEVDVTIFSDTYCNATINKGAGSKMPEGFDAATMVCAGEVNGGKDACQGDSGGPLVIAGGGCIKAQIGITSIGSDCGLPESPGVYTRVSEYVPWIEGIVWS